MPTEYDYKFTAIALSDIDEALSYISNDLANRTASKNLMKKIEDAMHMICLFPYAYADCSYYMIHDKTVRHIKIGNYVMIYRVIETQATLHILRFRYSRMNFSDIDID